jgi:hypothetical protein
MSYTEQEFKKIIYAKYPNKYITVDIDPIDSKIYVCAFDVAAECRKSLPLKLVLATHILYDGQVCKDSDNLFSFPPKVMTGSKATFTINGQHVGFMDGDYFTIDDPHSVPVCQCGKEKHGFAKHSDWCDIKEGA